MPLRQSYGARRYNELIALTYAQAEVDEFGHATIGEAVEVCRTYAYVRQMSASKTMLTFQQADVIGLDIEMRNPGVVFNGLWYRGHLVRFSEPEQLERGRILRISGFYQQDNPQII